MNETSQYQVEDVEKFLQINREAKEHVAKKIMQNLLDLQEKISIFKGIHPEELKAIVYDLKFVTFKYKDFILKQNDISQEIFYIICGECHIFSDNKKVGQLSQGEVFGEAGAIFKTKRNASVICASKEVTLLSFRINEDNMEFCSNALAILYKNLASEINAKLLKINYAYIKK